jgi:hypothetical protein
MMRAPIKANAAQIINALIGRVSPIHSLLFKNYGKSLGDFMQQASEKCAAMRRNCEKTDMEFGASFCFCFAKRRRQGCGKCVRKVS